MSAFSKSDYDYINLGVCIKNQADRLGIEHEGIPIEGVVVRIAERALAVQDTEEPEGIRWFTAAYRARNGNVIAIGVENTMRGEAEHTAEEFRREDPDGPEYFVASRIQQPWLPVEQEGETDEH